MFQLLTHNFLDVVLLSSWKKFFHNWQKSEHKGSIINYLQHLLQESGQQAARRASLVEEQQELQEGKAEVEEEEPATKDLTGTLPTRLYSTKLKIKKSIMEKFSAKQARRQAPIFAGLTTLGGAAAGLRGRCFVS